MDRCATPPSRLPLPPLVAQSTTTTLESPFLLSPVETNRAPCVNDVFLAAALMPTCHDASNEALHRQLQQVDDSLSSIASSSFSAYARRDLRLMSPFRAVEEGIANTKPPSHFVCAICDRSFTRSFTYRMHERIHTGERPFQCIVCGRAFTQQSNVMRHLESHKVWPHRINSLMIIAGDNATASGDRLVGESSLTSHQCPYCSSKLANPKALRSHVVLRHSNEKQFECPILDCAQRFTALESLLIHLRTHDGAMIYRCRLCAMQFASLREIGDHQFLRHRNRRGGKEGGEERGGEVGSEGKGERTSDNRRLRASVYKCRQCSECFQSAHSLRVHERSDSHVYACDTCATRFGTRRALRRHVEAHRASEKGERFVCAVCGESFASRASMQNHEKTQHLRATDAGMLQCADCAAVFKRADTLKRHRDALHKPDANKPVFVCSVNDCGKRFKRGDRLRAHVKAEHAAGQGRPAKPAVKCPHCGRQLARQRWLKMHLKTCQKAATASSSQIVE